MRPCLEIGHQRFRFFLPLALAFLFETWIWDRVAAAAQRLAALVRWAEIRAALMRVVDRLPAWAKVMNAGRFDLA